MVISSPSKEIICTYVAKGRKHDYRMCKESALPLAASVRVEVDSGYQGLQKQHPCTTLPFKGSKKKPLSKEQRKHNRSLASSRVIVEHTIRKLKIFRILKETYRNRRKRFLLRLNLIAGLLNFQLHF